MEKRRVVITGMGAVTPVGNTMAGTWEAVRAGVCGIGPITRYDASGRKVQLAGEVKNLDLEALLGRRESKRMDRFTQLALVAADEAVAGSGLELEGEDRSRCGVLFSSGIGGCAPAWSRPAPAAPTRWGTLSATSGTAMPR